MSKIYNWAVLGCGRIANKFVNDLKLLPNAKLYAAASRDLNRAQQFANELGFEKAYGNYTEMVTDPNVDVVYIATPHSHHFEHTMLCLKHKKASDTWRKGFGNVWIITRKYFIWQNVISCRFRHFFTVHDQHVGMHQIIYRRMIVASLSLCNLAFMVREFQIHSATMDVKMFSQIFSAHGCTFQMPAGETITPW